MVHFFVVLVAVEYELQGPLPLQDLGGYYKPVQERADAAMCPSETLNAIILGV